MFTGIVEERGVVDSISPASLRVGAAAVTAGAAIGDSIAVNGVCLTVVERSADHLAFDVSEETVRRTSFSRLAAGDVVNLERPVTLMSRLGGHLVQGHVDGVGELVGFDRTPDGGAWMTVTPPDELRRYLVEKGSVTVDGVSLTVAAIDDATFSVALIPHTLEATTLGTSELGHPVNLEVDVIARYVESLLDGRSA
ncbi:MAG TPA: riboflavin synthase [Actinomycetota bacterium]|nr:riboflavin synthase [Actinomycetota bacterium]